jgi:hypothetical protein
LRCCGRSVPLGVTAAHDPLQTSAGSKFRIAANPD